MPATIEIVSGDPFGLVPGLLRKGAQTAQTDPALGGVVLSSGTDEFTSPAVCEDGAGGSLTGACSLGPSGARGHGVVVHIVGVWTINPTNGYYGSGLAVTVNGPNAVVAVSQHQAQTPPRLSQVALAVIPNVVTVSGGGGGGQDDDSAYATIAWVQQQIAGISGGGGSGMTIQDLITGLQSNHDLRAAFGGLISSATVTGMEQAVTSDHTYRAGEGSLIESATQAADSAEGVLTKANFGQTFHDDPNVYHRIDDTAYEADVNAEKAEKP
jgi:hypothetical protein